MMAKKKARRNGPGFVVQARLGAVEFRGGPMDGDLRAVDVASTGAVIPVPAHLRHKHPRVPEWAVYERDQGNGCMRFVRLVWGASDGAVLLARRREAGGSDAKQG